MKNKIKCKECGSDIHLYIGDTDIDKYMAYSIDENGEMDCDTDILPRMDRVDEVYDEEFYMCSNGDCMKVYRDFEELLK